MNRHRAHHEEGQHDKLTPEENERLEDNFEPEQQEEQQAESDGPDGSQNQLQDELAETKDKYLRLVAEFDNFRRRTAKERMELMQTAGKDIIESLLVVLDDTDRAARQIKQDTDVEHIKEGISLVFNKLRNILSAKGLKKMESQHQPFDPDLHDAVTEIPAPSPDLVGKVVDVIEPGYYLNDRIIRHAKVVVGK